MGSLTKEVVEREYHDDYVSCWPSGWHAPTGRISVVIARRGLRVVERSHNALLTGNVLIVSHKATIRVILCGLLASTWGAFVTGFVVPLAR